MSSIKEGEVKRIGGYLHKLIPVRNAAGEIVSHILKPLSVEFKPRDLMQTVVGSTFLAIPITYTEEAWNLGRDLPLHNIVAISVLSFVFLALFIYLNYYRYNFRQYKFEFVKRVVFTYLVSLVTVGILISLVDKAPWQKDLVLTLKRIVVIAFPASMSATLTDLIK